MSELSRLENETDEREFNWAIRTFHWATILLENRGIPYSIIIDLKDAETHLLAQAAKMPNFDRLSEEASQVTDVFYVQESQIIQVKPLSDKRQEALWIELRDDHDIILMIIKSNELIAQTLMAMKGKPIGTESITLINRAVEAMGDWLTDMTDVSESILPKSEIRQFLDGLG